VRSTYCYHFTLQNIKEDTLTQLRNTINFSQAITCSRWLRSEQWIFQEHSPYSSSGRWSRNMTCIPREFYWSQLLWKLQVTYNKTCHSKTQWWKHVLVLQWTWPNSSQLCSRGFKPELYEILCLFFSVLYNWHDTNRPCINYAQRITSRNKWQYMHINCPSFLFKEISAKFERQRNLAR
jgi:hypothetical protein